MYMVGHEDKFIFMKVHIISVDWDLEPFLFHNIPYTILDYPPILYFPKYWISLIGTYRDKVSPGQSVIVIIETS